MYFIAATTPTVAIDYSIKLTDILTIIALFFGPLIAVLITENSRKKDAAVRRKLHIFRTLMGTRNSSLAANHIEAINLVEVEFKLKVPLEKNVIDAWKLYLNHLRSSNTSGETWEAKRKDLLMDLLFEMSKCLGYGHDKAEIQVGAYYPQAYVTVESENNESRRLWLEVLRGKRQIPMKAEIFQNNSTATKTNPEKSQ
jgi:hypothetical protein